MRKFSLFFILLGFSLGLDLQAQEHIPQVSILTISPGKDLYSIFGHSAIRIQNGPDGQDLVFDFGTFDFNTPGFYLKFIRGQLDYALSVRLFSDFQKPYLETGQSVFEQVLDLDPKQALQFNHLLRQNLLPENRFYPYDFFFDNCATRITDLLRAALDQNLRVRRDRENVTASFRELVSPYLKDRPWIHLGIDLILGPRANEKADLYQRTFLPDHLNLFLSSSLIVDRPLVKKSHLLITGFTQNKSTKTVPPTWVFFFLFVLSFIFSFWEFKGWITLKVWDISLFLIAGLIGSVLLFMWIFTDHQATHANTNLGWAWPTHLLFAASSLKPDQFQLSRKIYCLSFTFFLILVFFSGIIPLQYPLSIFLLMGTLWFRSLFTIFKEN